jgi:hypothetical protein
VSAFAAGALGAGVLAAGAGAVTAGLASAFFSSFLAGSAAKAVTANAEAIKVAINFMIKFPFRLCRNLYPYIYTTR